MSRNTRYTPSVFVSTLFGTYTHAIFSVIMFMSNRKWKKLWIQHLAHSWNICGHPPATFLFCDVQQVYLVAWLLGVPSCMEFVGFLPLRKTNAFLEVVHLCLLHSESTLDGLRDDPSERKNMCSMKITTLNRNWYTTSTRYVFCMFHRV